MEETEIVLTGRVGSISIKPHEGRILVSTRDDSKATWVHCYLNPAQAAKVGTNLIKYANQLSQVVLTSDPTSQIYQGGCI